MVFFFFFIKRFLLYVRVYTQTCAILVVLYTYNFFYTQKYFSAIRRKCFSVRWGRVQNLFIYIYTAHATNVVQRFTRKFISNRIIIIIMTRTKRKDKYYSSYVFWRTYKLTNARVESHYIRCAEGLRRNYTRTSTMRHFHLNDINYFERCVQIYIY